MQEIKEYISPDGWTQMLTLYSVTQDHKVYEQNNIYNYSNGRSPNLGTGFINTEYDFQSIVTYAYSTATH